MTSGSSPSEEKRSAPSDDLVSPAPDASPRHEPLRSPRALAPETLRALHNLHARHFYSTGGETLAELGILLTYAIHEPNYLRLRRGYKDELQQLGDTLRARVVEGDRLLNHIRGSLSKDGDTDLSEWTVSSLYPFLESLESLANEIIELNSRAEKSGLQSAPPITRHLMRKLPSLELS